MKNEPLNKKTFKQTTFTWFKELCYIKRHGQNIIKRGSWPVPSTYSEVTRKGGLEFATIRLNFSQPTIVKKAVSIYNLIAPSLIYIIFIRK